MHADSPLFIVGMPRSGTKLIRDLLNTHSRISIPEAESHFIPYFCQKYGTSPDFSSTEKAQKFVLDFEQSTFFINTSRAGVVFESSRLLEVVKSCSWAEIFRYILLTAGPAPGEQVEIWGDKTPGYIKHIKLLSAIFPQARFLHIVRDPRDYARSVQKAWGKNPFRAAVTWQNALSNLEDQTELSANNFISLRYEDLIRDTQASLQKILLWLNLAFESGFGTLKKPSENLGDAKGTTDVLQHNSGKYRKYFTPRQLTRIERICARGMRTYNYSPEYSSDPLMPSHRMQTWWKMQDGFASMRFHINEKGWRQGVQYFLRFHSRSSWRAS